MYARLLELPDRTFLLFGPRSTGKSTWLRSKLPNALWFDLLDQSVYLELLRDQTHLSAIVAGRPKTDWVVIDEVQKLPSILDEVHRILANPDAPVRFALTGSSARKLKRGGANLLAGRAINRQFFPLVGAELEYDFELDDLLSTGTLPNVRSEPQHAVDVLEAYAQNYVREEVQQEALVRDIGSFTRFLDVAALMNGQTLNLSNVARDAAVARVTADRYFEILEDTLISVRIPAWKPRARVKESGSPKFYLFDPGVARALSRRVRLPVTDEKRGALLETLILNELRAYMNQVNTGGTISYWGTPSRSEVDFVWTLGDRAVAIEVKATTRWRPSDERHLRSLLEGGHVASAFGVYRGEQELRRGDVWVLPVKSFMRRLQAGAVIG